MLDVQFACSDSSGKIDISKIETGGAFKYLSNFVNLDELHYVGAASDTVVRNGNFALTVNVPADTPAGTYTLGLSDRYMAFGEPTEDMLSMSFTPLTIKVVDQNAEAAEKTIAGLGTTAIAAPTELSSINDPWKGSFVYYGTYNGSPVRYRVLDPNTTEYSADGTTKTMLLDCDTILFARRFHWDS